MKWLKDNKNGLLVGIVSTILCSVGFKFGKYIIDLSPEKGSTFFTILQNHLYKIAARQNVASYSEYYLIIIFAAIIGAWVGFIITGFRTVNYSDTLNKIKESGVVDKATDDLSDKDIKLIKKYNKLKDRTKAPQNSAEKTTKSLLYTLVILLILLLIMLTSCAYYPSQLWKNFELDIVQISPYLEVSEIQMIRSEWVSMTGKKDYMDIYDQINSIRSEKNIEPRKN